MSEHDQEWWGKPDMGAPVEHKIQPAWLYDVRTGECVGTTHDGLNPDTDPDTPMLISETELSAREILACTSRNEDGAYVFDSVKLGRMRTGYEVTT